MPLPRDRNGFRIIIPPFEIYGETKIADGNGHLCDCDTPKLAVALLGNPEQRKGV